MDLTSIPYYNFLIFVIPGFITVWTYRHVSWSDKKSCDFEYLGLSFFWGLIMLLLYGLINKNDSVKKLLENPYIAAFVLSGFGLFVGWLGGRISRKFKL
jgi:hypothetical protein